MDFVAIEKSRFPRRTATFLGLARTTKHLSGDPHFQRRAEIHQVKAFVIVNPTVDPIRSRTDKIVEHRTDQTTVIADQSGCFRVHFLALRFIELGAGGNDDSVETLVEEPGIVPIRCG